MSKLGGYYVHGTSARKVNYPEIDYPYIEVSKVIPKQAKLNNNRAKVKLVVFVLWMFLMGLFVMFRYAMITELNYNIDKLTTEFDSVRSDNSRLKMQIESQIDLSKIKEIAESRLGMQKLDKYQTVYVKVPKSDFTIVAEQYEGAEQAGSGVINWLSREFNRLTNLMLFKYNIF